MIPITKTKVINKISIPSEEIDKVMVFKCPFTLKNAVKNAPSNRNNNKNKSNDSGKGVNTSGITKINMINVRINTREITLRYFFINETSLLIKHTL